MLTSIFLTFSYSYAQPQQPSSALPVPIFAPAAKQQQAQSSPLVFSTEYIEAQLARHGGKAYAPPQQKVPVGGNVPSLSYGQGP